MSSASEDKLKSDLEELQEKSDYDPSSPERYQHNHQNINNHLQTSGDHHHQEYLVTSHRHSHNMEILKESNVRILGIQQSCMIGEKPKLLNSTDNKNLIDFSTGSFQINRLQNTISIEHSITANQLNRRQTQIQSQEFKNEKPIPPNQVDSDPALVTKTITEQNQEQKIMVKTTSVPNLDQSYNMNPINQNTQQSINSSFQRQAHINRRTQSINSSANKINHQHHLSPPMITHHARHVETPISRFNSPQQLMKPGSPQQIRQQHIQQNFGRQSLTINPRYNTAQNSQQQSLRNSINFASNMPPVQNNIPRYHNRSPPSLNFQPLLQPQNQFNQQKRIPRVSRISVQENKQTTQKSISSSLERDRRSISGSKPNVHFTYTSNEKRQSIMPNLSPPLRQPQQPHQQPLKLQQQQHQPQQHQHQPQQHQHQPQQQPQQNQPIQKVFQEQVRQQRRQQFQVKYHELYGAFRIIMKQLQLFRECIQNSGSNTIIVSNSFTTLIQKIYKIEQRVENKHQTQSSLTSKIEELSQYQQQVESLMKHLEIQKEENRQLMLINSELDGKVGSFAIQYSKLDKEYHQLERLMEEKSSNILQLTSKIKQLQFHNQQLISSSQLLQQQISQHQQLTNRLQIQINTRNSTISYLENQLVQKDKSIQSSQNNNHLYEEIHQLQLTNNELLETNSSLLYGKSQMQVKLSKLHEQIDRLQQQIQTSSIPRQTQKIVELNQTIITQNNTINQLQSQISSLARQKDRFSNSLNNLNLNMEITRQSNTSLEHQNKVLLEKNNTLRLEIADLKSDNLTAERKLQEKFQQKLQSLQNSFRAKYSEVPVRNSKKVREESQVEDYEKEIDRLKAEVRAKQQDKRKLEDQIFSVEENSRRKVMEKDSEIRLLNDKIMMVEEELKRKIKQKQRKIANLEEEIEAAHKATPSKQVAPGPQSNSELKSLKEQYSRLQTQYQEIVHQKGQKQQKILNHNKVVASLEEQLSKFREQIVMLKRQLSGVSSLENEIKILTDSLQKKNAELLQLKSISFQYNQLQLQMQTLKKQRNNLKQLLRSRTQEIENLHNANYQLQRQKSSANKQVLSRSRSSSRPLILNNFMDDSEDYQIMTDSVRRKNQEISKLKQTNQLKNTSIEQLEYEIQKLKNKLSYAERNLQHEKSQSESKIDYLQNRIKELETKLKNYDESQRIIKSNYEQQIANLELQNKDKDDGIKKLQGENKVFKIKLKGHDNKVQDFQNEIEGLKQNIRQLEAEKSQFKKQINGIEDSTKFDKNTLYDEYQVKISELETAATIKDNKIKHLQNSIANLKLKITSLDSPQKQEEEFMKQQHVEILKKKIAEYESRLFQQNNSKMNLDHFKLKDYGSIHLFEQKVIYNLKSENERLRSLLNDSSAKNWSISQQKQAKYSTPYLQDRLIEFNNKLEGIIKLNKQMEEEDHRFMIQKHQSIVNRQLQKNYERRRGQLLKQHQQQIREMQAWMTELHRYCASLEQIPEKKTTKNNSITINYKEFGGQEIIYYKEKIKELQQMVDEHIKLNRQLKEKLEQYLKVCADPNMIIFFKEQINRYETQIEDYENKIKKLNEKNSYLQKELDRIESDQSFEIKIMELENIINELNRKLASCQMQIEILTSDANKFELERQQQETKIMEMTALLEEKSRKYALLQRTIKKTEQEYDEKLKKSNHKVSVLEAEIERLNELINNQDSGHHNEIVKLNAKISQLHKVIQKLEEDNQIYLSRIQQFQRSGGQHQFLLKQKLKEIQSLTNTINTQTNRIKLCQEAIDQAQLANQSLKDQINKFKLDNSELQTRYSQLNLKYAQISNRYEQLSQQHERIVQLYQQLTRERDSNNGKLRDNQNYIQELQSTIKQLKQNIQFYRQNQEGNHDEVSKLKRENSELRYQIENYEQQIERLTKQVAYYKKNNENAQQQISKLQAEIFRLEKEIENLRYKVMEIQNHMEVYDNLKRNIKYNLEYLRSDYLMLESLVGEFKILKEPSQTQIYNKVIQSINEGLIKCGQALLMCDQQ